MRLKVLVPFQVFVEQTDVLRLVVETPEGSFGLWPNRLDCVAALAPGILTYETQADGEIFMAVDEGVMVKTGTDVCISVRRAHHGGSLSELHETVTQEFLDLNEKEQSTRAVMAKLETGFLHRLAHFQHE